MQEKRFTPGPWFVQDDEWDGGDTANITSDFRSDNSIVHVAQVIGGGSESGFDGDFSLEQKANAKLIASAPELLEALQYLFDDYKELADSGDAGNWRIEDIPAGKKALQAIAKALGKE